MGEEKKAVGQETEIKDGAVSNGAAANADNKADNPKETLKTAQDGKKEQSTEELLKELIALQKKEAGHARLMAFLMACFVAIILVAALVLIPKVIGIIGQANATIAQVQDTITQAQGAITKVEGELENVSGMVKSITTTSDNVNGMLEENTESLNGAIKELTEIDFAGLNGAIKDLQDAIRPFAALMRRF